MGMSDLPVGCRSVSLTSAWAVENPYATDDLLRLGLHRLLIGEFPVIRGLATVPAFYDGAAELERGLDILLTGLTSALPSPASARPRS